MRKRNVAYLLDKIFWYVVYMLPLLIWLIILIRNGFDTTYTLSMVFETLGLGIVTDNVILTSLMSIVGVGGVFPIFASNEILIFFTWFIGTLITHLFVDFILFIPRLAHKWLGALTKDGD